MNTSTSEGLGRGTPAEARALLIACGVPEGLVMNLDPGQLSPLTSLIDLRARLAYGSPVFGGAETVADRIVEFANSREKMFVAFREDSLYLTPNYTIMGGIDIVIGNSQEFEIRKSNDSGFNNGKYVITVRVNREALR